MMATAAEEIHHSSPRSENNVTTVSFKITRKNQDRPWKLRFIYLQCYFISVATILGTGILGLPVTIAHAGLLPFLLSFVTGFFIQALLIYLFVDLLQRCRVAQMESVKMSGSERILMQEVGLEEPVITSPDVEEDEEEGEDPDRGLLQRDVSVRSLENIPEPNLHIMGVLFLNKYMSHAFNFILLFQFISIGISYTLAGSEAYADLLHVSHIYVIPVFTWVLSLGILLAQFVIQPITSLLTLIKGTLLVVTVSVTFVLGSEVHQEMTNDFTQIGKPFLMGTVALGGIVNVMPFLFSEISHNKSQIMWFRRMILGGLFTCSVLNILWCWAVLEIVPQLSVQRVLTEDGVWNKSSVSGQASPQTYSFVYSNVSLEEAERAGEIATIPLTKIINQKHSRFSWVAELIQIFIAVSITVSFLVMGSAMKHTIDGLANAHWDMGADGMSKACERSLAHSLRGCSMRRFGNGLMSLLAFGVIFIVAAFDPKGFVVMLDKVVSFSLNTEVGLFIVIMLRTSRSEPYRQLSVPLPVDERTFQMHWILPVYFLFAVGYDIFISLTEVADSWIQTQSQVTNSTH
ncbi:hypothetical protein AGOR_G00144850 [Albula goreensis]|uniref:Uncharacterized protein n=1 Tax=Albula goreensis TaxID=1534307 RepID=A0A8T3D623_9TELE|nr:hypothetical protein AGOR_G00144850 [Albula goreensis]